MNTFRLSNSDFNHLNEVNRINGDKPGEYKTNTIEKQVKAHIEHVKGKMHILLDYLKNEKYFTNKFAIGISRIRKRTQVGGIPGKYRNHLWIWMVDKNNYNSLKKKGVQSPQLHLPQIQISINRKNFTSAELWFEHSVLNQWRDRISDFLLNSKQDYSNNEFYIFNLKEDEIIFDEFGNKNSINNFVNMLNSRNDLKGGIGRVYLKKEVVNKTNLYYLVIKNLKELVSTLYSPIIGFTNKKVVDNKKFKLRNRKESKDITVKKIFRKGTKGGEVSQKHKEMQNKYLQHLQSLYGEKKAILEKNFVDIRVDNNNEVQIYELKTDKNAHNCIRQAMGQLLFYSWRIKNTEPKVKKIKLIVMGINELENDIQEFYTFVKDNLNMELEYIKYPFKL